MDICKRLVILWMILVPLAGFAQSKLKLDCKGIAVGETLNYKGTWGLLTIGSGTTKIDRKLYKVGSAVCYRLEVTAQTNGLAKLFYLHDKWISYIDTATISTHRSYRSIREGNFELDELVHFNQLNQKAEVRVYDQQAKTYVLKDTYDIPENARDVIAGFVVFRFVDLSKYSKGDIFTVNGFYEDEGYNIDVIFEGEEYIQTEKRKILCYKLKPILPKNKVFNGRDAVDVWLSANKSKSVVRMHARMFIGNIWVDLVE